MCATSKCQTATPKPKLCEPEAPHYSSGMIRRPSFGKQALALCALSFGTWIGAPAFADSASSNASPTVIVVVGAPGEEEFGTRFNDWGAHWEKAARAGGAKLIPI